jgi:hypothetical protein
MALTLDVGLGQMFMWWKFYLSTWCFSGASCYRLGEVVRGWFSSGIVSKFKVGCTPAANVLL